MGLFSKKPPCPICGGKISWFLPSKIEGQYICDTCYGKIDMPNDKKDKLTMQGFQEYLAFYDENLLLRQKFVISERIDFGVWDTKIIFDFKNKLFCMSKNPDKTVFEGKQLKSFVIKEDSTPLYEGSAKGLSRYASMVPERVMAMSAEIDRFMMRKRMAHVVDKMDDGKVNGSTQEQYFDVPEPFKKFNVELHFNHPYWKVIKCDMDGPRFDMHNPNVNDYLESYQNCIHELEKLYAAFKKVSFPDVAEQSIGLNGASSQTVHTSPTIDTAEEIKKYKALLEEGILTQKEFDAKKKQLLGI